MTTRTYYLPKNRIAIHVLNYIVSRVPCSIGEMKVNKQTNTIRVPVTCNNTDIAKIERILKTYDMIGE